MAEIPKGFCQCGCGGKTTVATRNDTKAGKIKGEPAKYICGHHPKERCKKLKGAKNPNWKGGSIIDGKGYRLLYVPEHPKASSNGYVREHILIAEKALGKPLPKGAVVHHPNGEKADNSRGNHVVCQDEGYHRLLHMRTEALISCGHSNWRKCPHCKKYDDPANMYHATKKDTYYHQECRNAYQRKRYKRREGVCQ